MTTRRKLIYGILALVIAFFAHRMWWSLANPLVWHVTYIGVHLARAVHPPDYDSLASVRMFDALAILINAAIYFAVLVGLDRLIVGLRTRRTARP